jgi:hypothetical protein
MPVATREFSTEELLDEIADVAHRVPGDVALHLRVVRPAILRTYVPAANLPEYLDLASEHDYALSVDWRLATDGAVRLVFTRDDLSALPPSRPALRPVPQR